MLYKWYDGKKYRSNKKTEAIFIKWKSIDIALCKTLDIPKNTVEIEMNCNVCVHKSHYTSKKRDRDYETLGERISEIEHNKEE